MSENLGFLTVIDQFPGLTGGYLVLNGAGRPLEFHCTQPLSPDKIQQILYGDTLQPFLYGERIAQTLLQRSKLPVLSILTDHVAVLPVQTLVSTSIIYVFGGETKPAGPSMEGDDLFSAREISEELSESLKGFGIDNTELRPRSFGPEEMPHVPPVSGLEVEDWQTTRMGNRLIAVPKTGSELLVTKIKGLARTIDLLEPFTRIRRALEEAKNVA